MPTATLAPGQFPIPFLGLKTATPGAGLPGVWITPEPGVNSPALRLHYLSLVIPSPPWQPVLESALVRSALLNPLLVC